MPRTIAQILADQKAAWRTLGPDPKPKDPTMGAILLQAIKPVLLDYIERARKGAPAAILAAITAIVAWLPTSIDRATETFRSLYTRGTVAIGVWLPTTVVQVTSVTGTVLDWLKLRIEGLKI